MKKWTAAVAVLLIIVAIIGLSVFLIWQTVPGYSRPEYIGQLDKSALITYDAAGVPYVQASGQEDVFAAQGYALARDRMFQMDMLRRIASGNLSQVLGPQSLPHDRLMRIIGLRRAAEAELPLVSQSGRLALQAYARGVNAYLRNYANRLPLEFLSLGYRPEPWTALDSLTLMKFYFYQQDESWRLDDLRQKILDAAGAPTCDLIFKDDWRVALAKPALNQLKSAKSVPAAGKDKTGQAATAGKTPETKDKSAAGQAPARGSDLLNGPQFRPPDGELLVPPPGQPAAQPGMSAPAAGNPVAVPATPANATKPAKPAFNLGPQYIPAHDPMMVPPQVQRQNPPAQPSLRLPFGLPSISLPGKQPAQPAKPKFDLGPQYPPASDPLRQYQQSNMFKPYPPAQQQRPLPQSEPIKAYPRSEPIRSYPKSEPIRPYPQSEPIRTYPQSEPIRPYPTSEPIRSVPGEDSDSGTTAPTPAPTQAPSGLLPGAQTPDSKQKYGYKEPGPTSLSPFGGRSGGDLGCHLDQLARTAEQYSASRPTFGSTAFVIPPSGTASGAPLLACDRHFLLTSPGMFYAISLSAPDFHVVGITIPGVPGVLFGRNENVAWSGAALRADVQDLFAEDFESEFSPLYKSTSGWLEAKTIIEQIPVRLAKDFQEKVFVTRHGPVLTRTAGWAVALSWTGLHVDTSAVDAILQLNKAKDYQDFVMALKIYQGSPQLFLYADKQGTVAAQAAGVIPVRAAGADGSRLSLGWTGKGDWSGFLKFSQLPAIVQPSGSKFPAGTAPLLIAANQNLSSIKGILPQAPASLAIGHQFAPPFRAQRLAFAMQQNNKADVKFATALLGDTYANLSPDVVRQLVSAVDKEHLIDQTAVACARLLGKWDGRLGRSSAQASIYEAFLGCYIRRLVEPRIGRSLSDDYLRLWSQWPQLAENSLSSQSPVFLPPDERTQGTFLLTTLASAVKSLKISFATNDPQRWAWQNIHLATFRHVLAQALNLPVGILDVGPIGVAGDADTLDAAAAQSDPGLLKFASDSGPAVRLVIDMADDNQIFQTVSPGQSGHFLSPHRQDQLRQWLQVAPAPLAFSAEQRDRQAKHHLVLTNESQ